MSFSWWYFLNCYRHNLTLRCFLEHKFVSGSTSKLVSDHASLPITRDWQCLWNQHSLDTIDGGLSQICSYLSNDEKRLLYSITKKLAFCSNKFCHSTLKNFNELNVFSNQLVIYQINLILYLSIDLIYSNEITNQKAMNYLHRETSFLIRRHLNILVFISSIRLNLKRNIADLSEIKWMKKNRTV